MKEKQIYRKMGKKKIINVPTGIKYVRDVEEFTSMDLKGHVIVNKVYPGCGMTTWYLTNDMPIVLCCPRKFLCKNKQKQIKDVFYYEIPKRYSADIHDILFTELTNYLNNCRVPKIIITYDSYKHVLYYLKEHNLLSAYTVICDEFHILSSETSIDPNTKANFSNALKYTPNVIYVSATPDTEEDMGMLSRYKDIPYIEFNWSDTRKVDVIFKPMKSVVSAVCEIIENWRVSHVFAEKLIDGRKFYSYEAVFFINDVTNICSILKKMQLNPDDVNILVADTEANIQKLRKAGWDFGKIYKIGDIPLEGESHKPLTFCSRSVYFGCDFCSTNAYTYVFADASSECKSIDITKDLPQIAGRQRLQVNVFRNELVLYCKTNSVIQTKEEFEKEYKEKLSITQQYADGYNNLADNLKIGTDCPDTSKKKIISYLVKIEDLDGSIRYEVSEDRMLADYQGWRTRNKYYKTKGSVQLELFNNGFSVKESNSISDKVCLFQNEFMKEGNSRNKLYMYCLFIEDNPECKDEVYSLTWLKDYREVHSVLGFAGIKSTGWEMAACKMRTEAFISLIQSEDRIKETFHPGEKWTRSDAKQKLQGIYDSLGINRTAKATDLEEFYDIQYQKVNGNSGLVIK